MTGLPDYDLALRLSLAGIDAITDTETVRPAESAMRTISVSVIASMPDSASRSAAS